MKLIAGLGNPTPKYYHTLHNAGFLAVDILASKLGAEFSKKECEAITAHVKINDEKVILAKPQTYMNLSGNCIHEIRHKYKIEDSDIMIIFDDVDLNEGALRVRASGSAGTHNGMKNIVLCLGNTEFPRIRIGVGRPPEYMPLADYVLAQITETKMSKLSPVFSLAADAAYRWACGATVDEIGMKYNISAK